MNEKKQPITSFESFLSTIKKRLAHKDQAVVAVGVNQEVDEALKFISDVSEFEKKINELSEQELVKIYEELSKDFDTYMRTEPQRISVKNRLMLDFSYTQEKIASMENC